MNLLKCILTANDCYKAGRKITPKGVMVHATGANNTTLKRYVQPLPADSNYIELMVKLGKNNNGNDWNHTNEYWKQHFGKNLSKCVHAFIGRLADGSIATVQTLPWDHRGWHGGGSSNDGYIGFEICEDGLTDRNYFLKVYQEAVELTAMLCKQYGFDPMEDGVVIDHSEGAKRGIASNHGDVAHWFPKHGKTMDDFRRAVQAQMGIGMTTTSPAVQTPSTGVSVANKGGVDVELPVLRKGNEGDSVRALQILLIGNGCSCGLAGADGDFGNGTLSAVKKYQEKKKLAVDGVVGNATWTALLK